jgi:mRNA interferase RelE/StbE
MHEILIEARVEHDLRKLPASDFHRIISSIKGLAHAPRPPGCRKIVGSPNDWRIRVGKYRVIYEIDDRERVIRITTVRHRKEAYRK